VLNPTAICIDPESMFLMLLRTLETAVELMLDPPLVTAALLLKLLVVVFPAESIADR
jgi:hypothetical protein